MDIGLSSLLGASGLGMGAGIETAIHPNYTNEDAELMVTNDNWETLRT